MRNLININVDNDCVCTCVSAVDTGENKLIIKCENIGVNPSLLVYVEGVLTETLSPSNVTEYYCEFEVPESYYNTLSTGEEVTTNVALQYEDDEKTGTMFYFAIPTKQTDTANMYLSQQSDTTFNVVFSKVQSEGLVELPIADNETLGGVIVGDTLDISLGGTINVKVDDTLNENSTNPVQNKVLVNTFKNLPAVTLQEEYSTDERCVGVWVDGKLLYQKTVMIPILKSNKNAELKYNAQINADVDFIMIVNGCIYIPTGSWVVPLNAYRGSTTPKNSVIYTSGQFWISLSNEWPVNAYADGYFVACITVQYTKKG